MHDLSVELFGITSEARESIEKATRFGIGLLTKLSVSVLSSVCHFLVKDFNFVSVENLDISCLPFRKVFFIVKTPVLVPEEPEASAYASTLLLAAFSPGILATAAPRAIFYRLVNCFWELELASLPVCFLALRSYMSILQETCWSIEQHPRSRKSRVTTSDYHNPSLSLHFYSFHGC